jgi:protein-S-isoprenylcysteine O-methyltransferase Ste14
VIKWILSFVVLILSLAVTVFVGFYVAIFLVGPHADTLPEMFHVSVGLLLLMIIIGVPFWLGRKTFLQFKRKEKNNLSI